MARVVAGDRAAFETLYLRRAPMVLGHLVKLVRDRTLAEDLMQTTFVSVLRSRDRYAAGQPVGPWLIAIATNAARDVLRRDRKRAALLSANPPATSTEPVMPDHLARRRLVDALAQLPPTQRQAVWLHKVEGLSFEQIAQTLHLTAVAARLRAHRGYQHLRLHLCDLQPEA